MLSFARRGGSRSFCASSALRMYVSSEMSTSASNRLSLIFSKRIWPRGSLLAYPKSPCVTPSAMVRLTLLSFAPLRLRRRRNGPLTPDPTPPHPPPPPAPPPQGGRGKGAGGKMGGEGRRVSQKKKRPSETIPKVRSRI